MPLHTYGVELPQSFQSTWVFVLRKNTASIALMPNTLRFVIRAAKS